MRRRLCVVTGSRAEYGLLHWVMREIQQDPTLELQVAVTGMHLSPEFGRTVQEIEGDGMPVSARVEMLLSSDSPVGIAKSIGLGVIGFADAFERLKPDIVVVLGDRFEILAAVQAALVARIPVAHLHGGELTEGAVDESIRHALTKLSHLHFVAAEPYRRRVIQMGERPERVFLTGAPGLDHIRRTARLTREELQTSLGISLGRPTFLVTYHPATLDAGAPETKMGALLEALATFPEATVLWTRPNADMHGRALNGLIDRFVEAHPDRSRAYTSLGLRRYLSTAAEADVVIGNSSSGLIEVPLLGRPTVNLGSRQGGRLRAPSVIDCSEEPEAIRSAILQALSPEHQAVAARRESPYGAGDASARIVEVLRTVDLQDLVVKRFFDGKELA